MKTEPRTATTVLIVGHHVWSSEVDPPDLPVAVEVGRYFDNVVIIVTRSGPDLTRHVANVCVEMLAHRPGLLGRVQFVRRAVRAAGRHPGIGVVAASEVWGGIVGLLLRRRLRRPVVMHLQGEVLDPPPGYGHFAKRVALGHLVRFLCGRADFVRCVSTHLMQSAVHAGIPEAKLRFIGTRVDCAQFDPDVWRARGRLMRGVHGWEGRCVVGYVGSLHRLKGVNVLLRAVARARRTLPHIYAVVVGGGPEAKALHALASDLGLGDAVEFVGRIEHQTVPAYLSAFDLFVFPSMSEGMPRAVLEAMAMTLPVVATNIPAHREVIEHDRTGILVPPGNVDGVEAALLALGADEPQRRRLGRAARQHVLVEHDFHSNVRLMADLYAEAAATRL